MEKLSVLSLIEHTVSHEYTCQWILKLETLNEYEFHSTIVHIRSNISKSYKPRFSVIFSQGLMQTKHWLINSHPRPSTQFLMEGITISL